MSDAGQIHNLLGEALLEGIRRTVREEVRAALSEDNDDPERLLSPTELAMRLHVPLSWVYEQSRQEKIPTIRLGRYIRFNLKDVIAAQKS